MFDSSGMLTSCRAVVISADLSAAGLQSGCASFSRAATPATWGAAIEVPLRNLKFSPGVVETASGV